MYCLLIRMLYLYNIEHDHTIRVFRLDEISTLVSELGIRQLDRVSLFCNETNVPRSNEVYLQNPSTLSSTVGLLVLLQWSDNIVRPGNVKRKIRNRCCHGSFLDSMKRYIWKWIFLPVNMYKWIGLL